MSLDLARVRKCLRDCDLVELFTQELGWDHQHGELVVTVDSQHYRLTAVAGKRGMIAYECPALDASMIPAYATRRKVERQVTRTVHEHIIVFTDAKRKTQLWQWVKREAGRPVACREHLYHVSQPGDSLVQKLAAVEITFEEEATILGVTDVSSRIRAAFDVERITKRFYERFREEHTAFLAFIKGLSSPRDRECYASLMLNRLMFVYFIQKKGFLNGDDDYLRNRLRLVKERRGKDRFLSFYRHFLLRLFHEGLGRRERNSELDELLGHVPFLNGGLFDVHALEQDNAEISIPDRAFERLFEFFEEYRWHLDERPLRNDREINPDVLGYIFEKYINKKEMGAYYTKEDITEYIARNSIIPHLFDAASRKCAVAFEPDGPVWQLLRENPDRYMYPALRRGIIDDAGRVIPLPKEIAAGLDDISIRAGWNRLADAPYGLPAETWREYVARRKRCLNLRERIAAGEVHAIDDLITLNLDVCQFAQAAIENCEGPDLLRAFFHAIAGRPPDKSNQHFEPGISILDPTCGSGAFLFAALNILEPLYDASLRRMRAFLDESGPQRIPTIEEELRAIIASGESATVEFKSSARWDVRQNQPNKEMEKVVIKTVAAMLNTKGGVLLIGVEDDGTIFGLKKDYATLGSKAHRDGFENWLMTRLIGVFGASAASLVAVDFGQLDGNDVCHVVVQPSPVAAYVKDGNEEHLYIRAGNSTRSLPTSEAVKYHHQRFEAPPPPPFLLTVSRPRPERGKKHGDFRHVLERVAEHPSERYFILKSIIIGNLYGVDIMDEAVEICKLRLFLKLVAQVESPNQIEPLPDIDFNIRVGNSLVGFASLAEVEDAITRDSSGQKRLLTTEDRKVLEDIRERADLVDRAYQQFRRQQTQLGGQVTGADKGELQTRLDALTDQLDRYVAGEYGLDVDKSRKYHDWRTTHRPFHWFVEFYGISRGGGFDIVIGNPPYVEYSKKRAEYTIRGYRTINCGNLYVFVMEKSTVLASKRGRIGLIVPLSLLCTDRMAKARQLLRPYSLWISAFDMRPASLFEGVAQRLSIVLAAPHRDSAEALYTGGYRRWSASERQSLIHLTQFTAASFSADGGSIPKVSCSRETDILKKIAGPSIELFADEHTKPFYLHRICRYFIKGVDFVPHFRDAEGIEGKSEDYKPFRFRLSEQETILCLLNSSRFYWFWRSYGDGFHCGYGDVYRMPFQATFNVAETAALQEVLSELMRSLKQNSEGKVVTTKRGTIEYQEFHPKPTKPLLDKIDGVIGRHFGFDAEELDFIVNYDIKYRMGQDEGDDHDDD